MKKTLQDTLLPIILGLNVIGFFLLTFVAAWRLHHQLSPQDQNAHSTGSIFSPLTPSHRRVLFGIGSYDKRAASLRDQFFDKIQDLMPHPHNIVIITLNKKDNPTNSFAHTIATTTQQLCYESTCLPAHHYPWLTNLSWNQLDHLVASDTLGSWISSVGQTFGTGVTLYPIVIEHEKENYQLTDALVQKIIQGLPMGDTIVIWSFRFTRHVPTDFSVWHDWVTLQTIQYNSFEKKRLNLESPNGVTLLTRLAGALWNRHFLPLFYGDNQSITAWKSGSFASHMFGVFYESNKKPFVGTTWTHDPLWLLSGYLFWSWVQHTSAIQEVIADGSIPHLVGIWFGDAHYTRGILYRHQTNDRYKEKIMQFLSQEQSLFLTGLEWYHKPLYGFDIAGFNLETAIATPEECSRWPGKWIIFRTDASWLDVFVNMGFTTTTLANNHSHDCRESWFTATQKYLDESGISHFGHTRYSSGVMTTTHRWLKVARFGFNTIDTPNDREKNTALIKEYKSQWYRVIVNIHWGTEYVFNNNVYQANRAHQLIDEAWVDFIIGHHPHVVQNIEYYKWVPIIYSLGNFVFDQPFTDTLRGMAITFAISHYGIKLQPLYFTRDKSLYHATRDK